MAIEIVDFPIKNGGSFHGKILVHQRVLYLYTNIKFNGVSNFHQYLNMVVGKCPLSTYASRKTRDADNEKQGCWWSKRSKPIHSSLYTVVLSGTWLQVGVVKHVNTSLVYLLIVTLW